MAKRGPATEVPGSGSATELCVPAKEKRGHAPSHLLRHPYRILRSRHRMRRCRGTRMNIQKNSSRGETAGRSIVLTATCAGALSHDDAALAGLARPLRAIVDPECSFVDPLLAFVQRECPRRRSAFRPRHPGRLRRRTAFRLRQPEGSVGEPLLVFVNRECCPSSNRFSPSSTGKCPVVEPLFAFESTGSAPSVDPLFAFVNRTRLHRRTALRLRQPGKLRCRSALRRLQPGKSRCGPATLHCQSRAPAFREACFADRPLMAPAGPLPCEIASTGVSARRSFADEHPAQVPHRLRPERPAARRQVGPSSTPHHVFQIRSGP